MHIQEIAHKSNTPFCGQVCHTILQEKHSKAIFMDEIEKKLFLDMLLDIRNQFSLDIYAYCVLDAKAHMLVDTAAGINLEKALAQLEQCFALHYEVRYPGMSPILFHQSCYTDIQFPEQLMEMCVQLHAMPQKLGYVRAAGDYWWSSLKEYLLRCQTGILKTECILEALDADRKRAARKFRKLQSKKSGFTI